MQFPEPGEFASANDDPAGIHAGLRMATLR